MTGSNRAGTPGASTLQQLDHALEAMAERLGLDARDARLIKFTHNATYLLPHERVVARLVGSRALLHRAPKVVAVARWLADQEVPAVRLRPDFEQPVHQGGVSATFWHAVPEVGTATPADLGHLLRQFHRAPLPDTELPQWDPMDDVRRRLRHADGVAADDLAFLRGQADELDEQLRGLSYALEPGAIHGDAFLGNVIATPDGPVLCDFDSTSIGPREWDLTPVALGHLRFGRPISAYGELAQAYGFDVTAWAGFGVLRRVRELKLTTSVVPVLRTNPAIVDQFRLRLASLRDEDQAASWTPFRT
jgi:hypothetical protein